MGGEKAKTRAVAEAPQPLPMPKTKMAKGGYYGAGTVQQDQFLAPDSSRRATFLGA